MKKKKLNGLIFEQMVRNGLNNLKNHEKEINELNVFPVPDGDTGSNMRLTLENGVKRSPANESLGDYLKTLSRGMLLGARGNSGVILSQIFNGFYQELAKKTEAKAQDIADALVRGYKVAYKAVVKPVEGTILTVAREGAENIRQQVDKDTLPEVLLSMYVAEMKKSLAYTPELLPALKEAGVVDSGAYGYIIIAEGMTKYLYGENVKVNVEDSAEKESVEVSDAFNEDSAFDYGYELEFVLQLMKGQNYSKFKFERYLDDLKVCGDSIVATQDGKRVKVHLHTMKPARAITFSQEYGEFVSFKLENMQLQHNEMEAQIASDKPHVPLAKIAVVSGDGFKEIYGGLGCDVVLDGGVTMNTSAQEFVNAFRSVNADEILVLPNNKNVVRAAEQAANISGLKNVTVLGTESPVQGYFALAMDVGDSDDITYRKQLMAQAADFNTLALAVAGKNYSAAGVRVKEGERVAVLNGKPVCGSKDLKEVVLCGMRAVEGLDEKESCIIFKGAGVSDADEEEFVKILEENFPDIEFTTVYGGQGIYSFLLGL